VTLAVTGNTISGRIFRRYGVPEFKRHRLPLTESRWDIRWLIGRRTKPTFCVFPVLTVAVTESVVTLVLTGNTNSGRVFQRLKVPEFERHRLPLTGSRWDIRWLIGRRTKPTFCVFPVFSVAVIEKCCDGRLEGQHYLRSCLSPSESARVKGSSTAVARKSMGHTVDDQSSNETDFLCILLYLAWRLRKWVVKSEWCLIICLQRVTSRSPVELCNLFCCLTAPSRVAKVCFCRMQLIDVHCS
jgi:hypothetical protein